MSKTNMKTKKIDLGTVWSTNSIETNEAVFTKVMAMLANHSVVWTGTMTALMKTLRKSSNKSQRKQLPGSPAALRVVLNKIANRLRNRGIGVKFGRTTDHARTRYVKFTQ